MPLFTSLGIALGASASAAFATGVTAAAIGGAVIGSSAYSITQASKGSKQPDIQMPTSPAASGAASVVSPVKAAETAQAAITQKKKAMSRSKSIYTSPLGIGEDASIARKTLLGQ